MFKANGDKLTENYHQVFKELFWPLQASHFNLWNIYSFPHNSIAHKVVFLVKVE